MRRLFATLAGLAMLFGLAGPAAASPRDIQVTAVLVGSRCMGGDIAAVRLTASVTGQTGDVRYRWDWTNNGSYDTPPLRNPSAQHTYGDEMLVTAKVGVLDSAGGSATDTVTFTTPRCE